MVTSPGVSCRRSRARLAAAREGAVDTIKLIHETVGRCGFRGRPRGCNIAEDSREAYCAVSHRILCTRSRQGLLRADGRRIESR